LSNKEFAKECYDKFVKRAKEKKRTLVPWKDHKLGWLLNRLEEEYQELKEAIVFDGLDVLNYFNEIQDECKDVANLSWFVFKRIEEMRREHDTR
jgi:hypothetical protein